VGGHWSGAEQKHFQAVLDAFQKKFPGVKVKYTSAGDNVPTVLSTAVAGGNPPDLASIASPASSSSSPSARRSSRSTSSSRSWRRTTPVVDHAEHRLRPPLRHGLQGLQQIHGLVLGPGLQERGREAAQDVDADARRCQDAARLGHAAYSIDGGDGWPETDLFENVYIRTAGATKYDQLSAHTIKWTDPSVKTALKTLAQIYSDTANIYGGTSGALQALLADSVNNVFSMPPKAAMTFEGDFVPTAATVKAKALTGYNVFPFPSINGSAPSVVGGGDTVAMFKDTPAGARRSSRTSRVPRRPPSGPSWAASRRPTRACPASAYPDALTRANRHGARPGEDLPLRHVRPRSRRLRRHGGSGRVEDPPGLPEEPQGHQRHCSKLEAAAAAAYKK